MDFQNDIAAAAGNANDMHGQATDSGSREATHTAEYAANGGEEAKESNGEILNGFTNRQFVALVREELAAIGRPDIAIERSWIDEDTEGCPFLLRVPVGTELNLPLKPMEGFFHTRTAEDRVWHAREFATALANLKTAEKTLEKYIRDIRRAANAAVAKVRADGLDISLDDVGLKETYAHHLTDRSWKEAALHVLACVSIRHTSFFLRTTTSSFTVEEPGHVEDELAPFVEEQREFQDLIAEMEAKGADLEVDAITLDLLTVHGLDAAKVLEQVWKTQCLNLKVQHLGRETSLSVISSRGRVTASIALNGAYWNGEYLWFQDQESTKSHVDLVGKSLGDLVSHPTFASRPIVRVENRHIDHIVFDLSEKMLFDADTGRIWRDGRGAA